MILCEYGHAMGNSLGDIKRYWDIFHDPALPSAQGGFIWDWVDQGVACHSPSGGIRMGYGGDTVYRADTALFRARLQHHFVRGALAKHDKDFCCNGVVAADRTPHATLGSLAECMQLVAASVEGVRYHSPTRRIHVTLRVSQRCVLT